MLRRTTPIHHAAKRIDLAAVVRELFQIYKCDMNYIDETGLTHFHVAIQFGCDEVVEKFLELGQNPNILVPETGDSPLHLAVMFDRKKIAEMLLRSGADPTLVNAAGLTPVDIICKGHRDDVDSVKMMFELGNEKYPLWLVHGALKSAVSNGLVNLAKLLLRRCADQELNSSLPENFYYPWIDEVTRILVFKNLHDDDSLEIVSKIIDEQLRELLHLALRNGEKKDRRISAEGMAELLLRNGSDPNLTDAEGSTALHFICKDYYYKLGEFVELFFKICDDNRQFVQIDAQDKLGRTPLQWAVANVKPLVVNLLLYRSAEMSRFVFPTESFYGARFNPKINYASGIKLIRASGALLTIEILESAGYELEWSDALTVMKFFAKHRLFEENLEKRWYDDVIVASYAKKLEVFPNLSLYDLIRMRPEEAETQLLFEVLLPYHESLHDILQELDLEAQDASDRASLRVTVVDKSKRSVELLLKAGADPNVTDAEGSTALHVICRRDDDNDNLMKMLFKICDDLEMPVDVDAQDNLRNTPLHLALAGGHIALTEVLLKQRADPNVANDEREIPLHVICHRKIDDDLMKVFFEICKDLEKKVQINVQNELNQTPLQLAVKYLMPDVLYALLTYGTTDLPSFVFPSAADFKQYLNIKISESTRNRSFKSQVICDAIFVIRHLWANGSELEVIEAPAIITLLINHVWFAMSENLIKKIFNDKYFAMEAKRIAVSQSRSLYELMKLPINKAARLFNYKDFKSTLSRRARRRRAILVDAAAAKPTQPRARSTTDHTCSRQPNSPAADSRTPAADSNAAAEEKPIISIGTRSASCTNAVQKQK
ncbi:unnamed protein product [Trichogramma brassicae]|uniref:Uncharacterized protein n=1 Tax=Trichogramma brassicae TaxID=86971 RepID=A0A6H5IU27_9HYME|nr:unnamed protein product [Trichogramma brassicae]